MYSYLRFVVQYQQFWPMHVAMVSDKTVKAAPIQFLIVCRWHNKLSIRSTRQTRCLPPLHHMYLWIRSPQAVRVRGKELKGEM